METIRHLFGKRLPVLSSVVLNARRATQDLFRVSLDAVASGDPKFLHAVSLINPEDPMPTVVGLISQSQEALARALVRDHPGIAEFHETLGFLLRKSDKQSAIEHLKEAAQLKACLPLAHTNYGQALLDETLANESGDYRGAIDEFRMALQLWPEWGRASLGLGKALLFAAKAEDAIPHLRLAVKLDSKNESTHYYLGSALAPLKQYDEAAAEFREALRLKDTWEGHLMLGETLAFSGAHTDAVRELRLAAQLNPNSPYVRDALSHELLGGPAESSGSVKVPSTASDLSASTSRNEKRRGLGFWANLGAALEGAAAGMSGRLPSTGVGEDGNASGSTTSPEYPNSATSDEIADSVNHSNAFPPSSAAQGKTCIEAHPECISNVSIASHHAIHSHITYQLRYRNACTFLVEASVCFQLRSNQWECTGELVMPGNVGGEYDQDDTDPPTGRSVGFALKENGDSDYGLDLLPHSGRVSANDLRYRESPSYQACKSVNH